MIGIGTVKPFTSRFRNQIMTIWKIYVQWKGEGESDQQTLGPFNVEPNRHNRYNLRLREQR